MPNPRLAFLTQPQVGLNKFCTLRAGGPAEWFGQARTVDQLAELAMIAQEDGIHLTTLGAGSNVLPSDDGVPGLTVHNGATNITFRQNEVTVDCGVAFQELFLQCAQRSLGGLEYAVGIPGTVGGALASNAGAYRSNISEFLTEVEVVEQGRRSWQPKDWMEFSYRDSRLRQPDRDSVAVLRVRFELPSRRQKEIYDEARDYQRQRIGKQPAPASAGSFFKNVNDLALAQTLDDLAEGPKAKGVIPAGFLMQRVGLKGARLGGAMFSARHANFMINSRGATATEIRSLAEIAIQRVQAKFHITLEPEVLYLGDWSRFKPEQAIIAD